MEPSSNERLVIGVYEDRGDYGLTDEEVTEKTKLPWNTVNAIRYALWSGNLITLTPHKRRTRNGAMAAVYAIAREPPVVSVDPIKFTYEDKVKARAALFAMVARDQDLGLSIPPAIFQLGRWLDEKVLLGEKKQVERRRRS
ncbi:MAG: hypothetical protein Q8Q14_07290 [Gemmatimonadales bacterium]|nr:hypothetical protein [Gemmatimonadales bacterium]